MQNLSNENIIQINKDGIQYLQFIKLLKYDNIINHAYSIGIDKNFRTTKDKEYISSIEDYDKLCTSINSNYLNIVKPNQAHTKNIKRVNYKINKNFLDINLEEYNSIDGVITNQKNIVLSTTNADCILMLFFDPIKKVIANIHSGWKGTLQRISTETVKKMKQEYKCNPKDIICCICPSIRKCHFEVSKDVQELYYREFCELKEINKVITKVSDIDKWYIDTVEINKIILRQAGLQQENIVDSGICSVCNSSVIHSYRVEKQEFKLNTALIELK